MLYKHYRYVVIIKVCLLIIAGFMLYDAWKTPQHNGGTLFIVSPTTTSIEINDILSGHNELLQGPWALIIQQGTQQENKTFALHIPWTTNTGYVMDYLQGAKPHINDTIKTTTYEMTCKQKIIVGADNQLAIQSCHSYSVEKYIFVSILILIGIIL